VETSSEIVYVITTLCQANVCHALLDTLLRRCTV